MDTSEPGAVDRRHVGSVPAETRRGFLGAVVAAIIAALIVGVLWLAARDAPSAGRDPNWATPMYLPTRPAPTATTVPAS